MPAAPADVTVLHLKNGDRLAGTIVNEDTNRVVISTPWIKELAVPLSAIQSREKAAEAAPEPGGPGAPPRSATAPAVTNQGPSVLTGAPVGPVTMPSTQTKPNPKKYWAGEARVGMDFHDGATEQTIYSGRFKLTYAHPYEHSPKQFFRNIFDYSLDYGWSRSSTTNASVISANRMELSDKTDVDVGHHKFYVYNLIDTGYDEILRIDFQYQVGPGLGYHLITASNFVANVESGVNYQVQYRVGPDSNNTKNVFFREAEDLTWKLSPRFTLTEKAELFPRADAPELRARIEANLSYTLWRNISLNLTLLDQYDTRPAVGVPNNDLQVHSSVGVKF